MKLWADWRAWRRRQREERVEALEESLADDDRRIAEIEAAKTEHEVWQAWYRGPGFSWLRVKESDLVFVVLTMAALPPLAIVVLLRFFLTA